MKTLKETVLEKLSTLESANRDYRKEHNRNKPFYETELRIYNNILSTL